MTATRSAHPAHEVLAELRARFPDAPFLALGQTVFWDEPVKAVIRCLLDDAGLGGTMLLGVHDTDFFAKTHIRREGRGRFALLPHNDGTTKDLWSAAGEISTLFGSETFPSRDTYARLGVGFEKVARARPEGRRAFLDAMTEAWGWRGLVYTGSSDLIVHRLPLKDMGDSVSEMLSWAFDDAVKRVAPDCCNTEATRVADAILGFCSEYRSAHPDKNLTDLFQDLLPRLYSLLMGRPSEHITVDCTAHLLRLTPETCSLPRFRFAELFIDPATRALATSAYNEAVAGSTIYTLDKFGAGALPFDLITPEHGRGTLRLTQRVLFVETRQPIAIGLKKPIESIQELAEIVTAKLGDHVTLVGKAVSLVSMLAQEFIFVFNEEGSMYVRHTRHMNDILARNGIELDLRPILRVRYHTWDALQAAGATLRLPDHLAAAFGRRDITAPEFSAEWSDAVLGQRRLCEELAAIRKPLDLMSYIAARDAAEPWDARIAEYRAAREHLAAVQRDIGPVKARVRELYTELQSLKALGQDTQRRRGEHFRLTEEWNEEAERARSAFASELEEIETRKRHVRAEIAVLNDRRHNGERGAQTTEARAVCSDLENLAEFARLSLVRAAVLTIEGLTHTNHRPSAWWIPLVDSSGAWFREIVATTELYTEQLLS